MKFGSKFVSLQPGQLPWFQSLGYGIKNSLWVSKIPRLYSLGVHPKEDSNPARVQGPGLGFQGCPALDVFPDRSRQRFERSPRPSAIDQFDSSKSLGRSSAHKKRKTTEVNLQTPCPAGQLQVKPDTSTRRHVTVSSKSSITTYPLVIQYGRFPWINFIAMVRFRSQTVVGRRTHWWFSLLVESRHWKPDRFLNEAVFQHSLIQRGLLGFLNTSTSNSGGRS